MFYSYRCNRVQYRSSQPLHDAEHPPPEHHPKDVGILPSRSQAAMLSIASLTPAATATTVNSSILGYNLTNNFGTPFVTPSLLRSAQSGLKSVEVNVLDNEQIVRDSVASTLTNLKTTNHSKNRGTALRDTLGAVSEHKFKVQVHCVADLQL